MGVVGRAKSESEQPGTAVERFGDGLQALVADDDTVTRRLLTRLLEGWGFQVTAAADGQAAIDQWHDEWTLALVDLQMPRAGGLDCLAFAQRHFPSCQVMVVSQFGQIRDAVDAMKQGAVDYFTKPVDPEELSARLRRSVAAARLREENQQLRQAVGGPLPMEPILARSPVSRQLADRLERIARFDETVLLTGESGTGKTTLARRIHQVSARAAGPFVSVSCASLPRDLVEAELFGHAKGAFTGAVADRPGRAEMADGGTLFLDEIGDLPLELQPKLLTFLEDHIVYRIGDAKGRRVSVRVIAATLHDLEAKVADGSFRKDLLWRLNVLPLEVPPLRDRQDDLLALAQHVLQQIARKQHLPEFRLTESAERALRTYDWPGNIRELENVLQRAAAFAAGPELTVDDFRLPGGSRRAGDGTADELGLTPLPSLAGWTLRDLERRALLDTLAECGGNKKAAAKKLGVDEKTIHNKLKRFE